MSKKNYIYEDVESGLEKINTLCSQGWTVIGGQPEIIYKKIDKTWMDDEGMWNTLKDDIPYKVKATLELIEE